MNELYNILSIFVSGGILFVCGLMFLFTTIPDNPLLGNYRKARYMMAGAYLISVAVGILEYLFQTESPPVNYITVVQTVTLIIATSQAFLFTFAILALLEVSFSGWRYILREAVYVLVFIAAIITAYFWCSNKTFRIFHYIFTAIYTLLLVHYSFMFLKSYRLSRLRMDNYFSDMEIGRLHWIIFSFFTALAVGVMALLSSIFMSTLVAMLFAVIFNIFYIFFAVRFINYAYQFQYIEHAMNDKTSEGTEIQCIMPLPKETVANNKITKIHGNTFSQLEKRLDEWVAGKGFTKPGITIDTLATQFGSNSKYISVYINTYKHQTFRNWINELRIGEAKILLLKHPEMTINEIAFQIGFSDKSHFLKQFKKQTNISTSDWKNLAKTQNIPDCTPK